MAGGRPTDYNTQYCKLVIDMMSEGFTITSVAKRIGVHRDTIYEWAKVYTEFSDSLKLGRQLSEAWWEEQGHMSLRDKSFNAVLWYMNMKNRFGWRDKVESTENVVIETHEERLERIKKQFG